MVTIKDIAKEAGVSHGTVSNVLNKKGNVTASKIKIVEEAAQRLGYYVNSEAQLLRKGTARKCLVLLFSSYKAHYVDFLTELQTADYEFDILYISKKSEIEQILKESFGKMPFAIICLGFSPYKYYANPETSVNLIEVDTYGSDRTTVGFDLAAIILQLNQLIEEKNVQSLSFLSFGFERSNSLSSSLNQAYHSKLPFYQHIVHDKKQLLLLYPQLKALGERDCVIVEDKEMHTSLVELYDWFGVSNRPIFCIIGDKDWLKQDRVHYIKLDYRLLAKSAYSLLGCGEDKRAIVIKPAGSESLEVLKDTEKTLRFLTIQSPMSRALKILTERYYVLSGVKVEIIDKSYDEILDLLSTSNHSLDVDLIRMDMTWLPMLGETIFKNLDEPMQRSAINKKIHPSVSSEYTHIGRNQYSIPFDISSQVLIYRKDVFEDSLVQRQYYEMSKKQLLLPKTFKEFDELSQFFTQKYNHSSPTPYAHSMALKSPVQATCDFTPRFREALLQSSLDMSIIEKVVKEYKQSFRYTKRSLSSWWEDFITNIREGNTVMEIVFSNYASPLFNSLGSDSSFEFGVGKIPGNQPVIGGGAIGIYKNSEKEKECLSFIDWLYTDEISVLLTSLGGFLPSKAVLEDSVLSSLYPWLANFDDTFSVGSRTKWLSFETDFTYEQLLGQELIEKITEIEE